MKSKALKNLNLIVLITFFINWNLHSQSHVIATVRKYDYPLPSGTIVTDIISRPHNIKNLPDSILTSSPKGYRYLKFGVQFVLPNDPYLTSGKTISPLISPFAALAIVPRMKP